MRDTTPFRVQRRFLRILRMLLAVSGGSLGARAAGTDPVPDLDGAHWVWTEPGAAASAPAATHAFRTSWALPPLPEGVSARLTVTADNLHEVFLNGAPVCRNLTEPNAWNRPVTAAVGTQLRPGINALAVSAANTAPGPAGLIAKLAIELGEARREVIVTDGEWRCSDRPSAEWRTPAFDDSRWARVSVLGPLGIPPWGDMGLPASSRPPLDFAGAAWIWHGEEGSPLGAFPEGARYFRAAFRAPGSLRGGRAEILIAADNLFTLHLNGKRVGRGSEWNEPCRYDVTRFLVPGENRLAVLATNTLNGPAGVLAKLVLARPGDDPILLASGKAWKTHFEAFPGWETPDFDDSGWAPARVLAPYGEGPWGTRLTIPREAEAQYEFPRAAALDDPLFRPGVVFIQGALSMGAAGQNFIQNIGVSRAYTEFDTPSPAALGERLYALEPFAPGGRVRLLHDAAGGVLGSPCVSYEGRTVYFTMAPRGEPFFHLFAVGLDGTGLRQVTAGPVHDFDPAEMPDGRLVFASTRLGTAEEYHGVAAFCLFTCQPDGSAIQPLTRHIVGDREPCITADGGLAFIRCDNFMERAKVETHIHRTRLDGSCGDLAIGPDRPPIDFHGRTAAETSSRWLRIFGAGSPAPLPDGRLAAISESGVVVSAQRRGVRVSAYVPYDLSALPDGRLLCTAHDRARFCVLDPADGSVAEVVNSEELALPDSGREPPRRGFIREDVHSVVFAGPRPRPRALPDLVGPEAAAAVAPTGYLYCQNVRNTRHRAADAGRIRAIRVYEGRPFSLVPTSTIYAHIGTEGRELGTVPLAADGSFYVEVPADRALALQAVDAEGRGIINEMSWIYVRPGERRACIGCHAGTQSAPPAGTILAAAARPLRLLGRGEPHRFRANNAANGGVLNMQMRRFREAASINLYRQESLDAPAVAAPLPPGRAGEVAGLCDGLRGGSAVEREGAVRRLAVLRDRRAVPSLVHALRDASAEVRAGAAVALASCGDRRAVPPLFEALSDPHPVVAQGAHMALAQLTGLELTFDAFAADRGKQAEHWRAALDPPDWVSIETDLCRRLEAGDPSDLQRAAEALGHVGGRAGAEALLDALGRHADGDLRLVESIARALGYLRDPRAVPALAAVLRDNARRSAGKGAREFGAAQRPVYLAAAAAEALGWMDSDAAEAVLVEAFPGLGHFQEYTSACGDHGWLVGCHSSVLHYRFLEAFDALGTTLPETSVPPLLRSLPMDKDRGLLHERDSYETLTARVLQRSSCAGAAIESCLAALGDPGARSEPALIEAVSVSPHAEAHVRPHSPPARAAQVLSVICLDRGYAPRVRERLAAFLDQGPSETRSWVCFLLIRLLGSLRDREAVALLRRVLAEEPDEAAMGTTQPPNHWVYTAWKPFFRAAAARALGDIGADDTADLLVATIRNPGNAPAVRQEAARALARLGLDAETTAGLRSLAESCPDLPSRLALLEACMPPP
ncbi:MAG: HEAT repeat domain-containing protein [Lentisphaeria bacterium]|nr:HEAT repeat domain-containing protein [Lentisphaeria bacterium]